MDKPPPDEHETREQSDSRATAFEPSWFNSLTGGTQNPLTGAKLLLDQLAWQTRQWPDWTLDTGPGGCVHFEVQSHDPSHHLVLCAQIGDDRCLLLTFKPDPGGWLAVTVHWQHQPMTDKPLFEAWIDQPYEEFEFWPPVDGATRLGQAVTTRQIPPGRMGKRMNWISIEAHAWATYPALEGLRNPHGFVVASRADDT